MELTKEYFDEKLEKLDKKFDGKLANFVTNDSLDQKLEPLRDDIRDLKNDVREIKATVTRIDKRDLEDSNSLAKLYLEHDRRMKMVEKLVKNSQV